MTSRLAMTVTAAVAAALLTTAPPAHAQASPQAAADALLAADRAFSRAAATSDGVSGLTAMFAADVIMPGPPGVLHRGVAAVTAALRATPDTATGTFEWTPIRAGLSADGEHGFTFGFMTLRRPDGTRLPLKYMSYWVKDETGWRVAGYKRARRPEGDVTTALMAPLLPATLVPVARDAARLEQLRQGLRDAERAFSNEAQTIGLGPAFVTWGSPTAVNLGGLGKAGYVVGNTAIGALVGGDRPGPSPVEWSTDVALVASSGDLGISFGYIRQHTPPAGAPAQGSPFFTIWHRASPAGPWRYVAE